MNEPLMMQVRGPIAVNELIILLRISMIYSPDTCDVTIVENLQIFCFCFSKQYVRKQQM